MSDDGQHEENVVAGVTVRFFSRDTDSQEEYTMVLEQKDVEVSCDSTIGWTFPDGTSSLQKVVINGKVYTDFDVHMKDVGLISGSVIDIYSEALDDDDDNCGDETN